MVMTTHQWHSTFNQTLARPSSLFSTARSLLIMGNYHYIHPEQKKLLVTMSSQASTRKISILTILVK